LELIKESAMAMNDDKNLRDTYLKQYSDGIEEIRLSCSKASNLLVI